MAAIAPFSYQISFQATKPEVNSELEKDINVYAADRVYFIVNINI